MQEKYRTGGEVRGEWVTTNYMVEKLKKESLPDLNQFKIDDVIKKFDGNPSSQTHRQRASNALRAAKSNHPQRRRR